MDAGELKDVTPGERDSARRRAHLAAGEQSEYRLRDLRPRGRKAATDQPPRTVKTVHAPVVKTVHATQTVDGLTETPP